MQQKSPDQIRAAALVIEKRDYDREANMCEFEYLVKQAAKQGAELVVTPEGFLEGYIIQDETLTPERYAEVAEEIPGGQFYNRICDLAKSNNIHIAAAMAEKRDDKFYNTCALINPKGELIGKYSKTHTLDDEPLNTKGDSLPVFDTQLGKIGIMICYDRQLPEVARTLTLKGADIILNPAAGMYGEVNTMMMRTRAYENGIPIIFSHYATALIIGRHGEIIKEYKDGEDKAVVADIKIGRTPSSIDHRRAELY